MSKKNKRKKKKKGKSGKDLNIRDRDSLEAREMREKEVERSSTIWTHEERVCVLESEKRMRKREECLTYRRFILGLWSRNSSFCRQLKKHFFRSLGIERERQRKKERGKPDKGKGTSRPEAVDGQRYPCGSSSNIAKPVIKKDDQWL